MIDAAIKQLQVILGKGLYPAAIPKVKDILAALKEAAFEAGSEDAKQTVSEWYEPRGC